MPIDPVRFVRMVMAALGVDGPTELARELGLAGYESPRRIRGWLEGRSAPNYESTMLMLERTGWLAIPEDGSAHSTQPADEELGTILYQLEQLDRKLDELAGVGLEVANLREEINRLAQVMETAR